MADLAALLAGAKADDREAERELLILAGSGDAAAQRVIRDGLIDDWAIGGGEAPGLLLQAEVLCRMLAARGGVEDRHRLGALLFVMAGEIRRRGDEETAARVAEESLGIFRTLVDEGDGKSLQALAAMGPEFPAVLAALDQAALFPDGLADKLAAGSDVTAIPPPIITTFAPYRPLSWRERLAERWDNAKWSVRIWWWGVVDRFNVKGF